MSISRRRFLRSGALGALSAGLILESGQLAFGNNSDLSFGIPQNTSGPFKYSRADFERHVGSTFQTRLGKSSVDLKLVRLAGYQSSSAQAAGKTSTESFVLAFRTPKSLPSKSATYKLEHSALGKFDLFMTSSEDHGKMIYTAVVNRIV